MHTLWVETGIEPNNKSSVSVRSGSRFGSIGVLSTFSSVQFDSIETSSGSVLVYQSHAVHVYFAFGSTVWWSFTIKMLK